MSLERLGQSEEIARETEHAGRLSRCATDQLWDSSDKAPFLIAGPCSAESRDQVITAARAIARDSRISLFRAGIWKPRTRLGSFEGVGDVGLEWLRDVRDETGLPVAVEITLPVHAEKCLSAGVDVLWIGARTSVNPILVHELARALRGVDVPVLVKNPVTPDLDAWLGALERFASAGVRRMAAVHRGFSTLDSAPFRNAPQWQIPVRLMSMLPDLPVICDPSHIAGNTMLLFAIATQALEHGMRGLMIECHLDPLNALSDPSQQLTPSELHAFLNQLAHCRHELFDHTS